MERLLDNAILAYNRCRDSGSEWGMQYWANVQKELLRKYSSKIHWQMKLYSLEYERWVRDPRISEAIDNEEVGTLYQILWEFLQNERHASSSGVLLDNEHQKAQKEEQD